MSNMPPAEVAVLDSTDEDSVIDYLTRNPDVLERHPATLAQLTFSHESGAAVSLVERQLKLLRDENQSLKNKLNELVHIARENEELSQRFHRLSLELMTHDNLHDVISLIRDQIQTFFYTDHVNFFFTENLADQLDGMKDHILTAESKHAAKIQEWIDARNPVFGPFDPGIRKQLFADAGDIPSCVLIPLYHTQNFGLLVLGSKSNQRFSDGMGTLFLQQLGDLVSSKLKHFLDRN
jgi:hypothetical protein